MDVLHFNDPFALHVLCLNLKIVVVTFFLKTGVMQCNLMSFETWRTFYKIFQKIFVYNTQTESVNLRNFCARNEQYLGRVSRSHVQRSRRTHRSTRFSKAWTHGRDPRCRCPLSRPFPGLVSRAPRRTSRNRVGSPAASMLGRFRRGSAPLSSSRARAPLSWLRYPTSVGKRWREEGGGGRGRGNGGGREPTRRRGHIAAL